MPSQNVIKWVMDTAIYGNEQQQFCLGHFETLAGAVRALAEYTQPHTP